MAAISRNTNMLNRSPASTTPFIAPVMSRKSEWNSQTLVNLRM